MSADFTTALSLAACKDGDLDAVPELVDALLDAATAAGASDVHLEPTGDALRVCVRLDGVLHDAVQLPGKLAPNVAARLKVLAGLLTYETTRPQEGRIERAGGQPMRVSTFPTVHGEKAVVRLLGGEPSGLATLEQLHLPADVTDALRDALRATSGAILLTGPAGSGKTTTAYASVREVVAAASGGRSVATLEDPVEATLRGVTQTNLDTLGGFDSVAGLRALLRQDPEVILLGEIRDHASAQTAVQAALTGQLLISTFHAGGAWETVRRLTEMGVPAYALASAVRMVIAQRLLRKLCACAEQAPAEQHAAPLGLHVSQCRIAAGCDACLGTGYRDRTLLAESIDLADPAVRARVAAFTTRGEPDEGGQFWARAERLVESGVTSPLEVVRVLGPRRPVAAE